MTTAFPFRAAMVVAHPDDEVLWGGGLILDHPWVDWHVFSICRERDPDRAPRFFISMKVLKAAGRMADLDDGPEQHPLDKGLLGNTLTEFLGKEVWHLLVTHGPQGEYTRHRRHEEVCEAVVQLWEAGEIAVGQLWMFAYHDHQGAGLPQAREGADHQDDLKPETWKKKYALVTESYGFSSTSWEARATPRREAFVAFEQCGEARAFVDSHAPEPDK